MPTLDQPVTLDHDALISRPPLARELTLRRLSCALTQRRVAQLVGIHPVSLSAFEAGSATPSGATLKRLREALPWPE